MPKSCEVRHLKSRKNRRKNQMAELYHVVLGKSISTLDLHERRPRRRKQFQQDKDSTATVFDVNQEDGDKTVPNRFGRRAAKSRG